MIRESYGQPIGSASGSMQRNWSPHLCSSPRTTRALSASRYQLFLLIPCVTVGIIRRRLDESGLLSLIKLNGLPRNPKVLIALFKLHLDVPALLLCSLKNHQAKA